MPLRDLLAALGRSWVVIVALAFIGIASGALSTLLLPPTFRAQAELYVAATSADNPSDLFQGATYTQIAVKNYAQLATTPYVLIPVAARIGNSTSVDQLASRLQVTVPEDTTVVSITGEGPTASSAIRLTSAVAESLQRVATSLTPGQTNEVPPVRITIVEAAEGTATRSAASLGLALAAGVLVGLAIGVGVALLREAGRSRLVSVKDVEAVTNRPVIAVVGVEESRARGPVQPARDEIRRDYGFLASRLLLQRNLRGSKVFAFVAPDSGSGTSSALLRTAAELSDAGLQVLIVDVGGGSRRVSDRFGAAEVPGIGELLRTRDAEVRQLRLWDHGPSLIPAGSLSSDALIDEVALRAALASVRSAMDVILLDAPPLLESANAAAVLRSADASVLVARLDHATAPSVSASLLEATRVDCEVDGVVVLGAEGAARRRHTTVRAASATTE